MSNTVGGLHIANIVYGQQRMVALERGGVLLSVRELEDIFRLEGSPVRFTDQALQFDYRVFSLGMAGLGELVECLGQGEAPRQAVLSPRDCLFLPPTLKSAAWAEFSVLADDSVPRFRWANARCLRGHDAPIALAADEPWPRMSAQIAAVIGEELHNASVQQAASAIAGFTILTSWSLPSRQRVLPSWGDCYTGQLGPYLVAKTSGDPTRWNVVVRVNGRTVVQVAARKWTTGFAEMIALASESAPLVPGDIVSSGPIAQVAGVDRRALQSGDNISVQVEGLGEQTGTLVSSDVRSCFLDKLKLHATVDTNRTDTQPPTGRTGAASGVGKTSR